MDFWGEFLGSARMCGFGVDGVRRVRERMVELPESGRAELKDGQDYCVLGDFGRWSLNS